MDGWMGMCRMYVCMYVWEKDFEKLHLSSLSLSLSLSLSFLYPTELSTRARDILSMAI